MENIRNIIIKLALGGALLGAFLVLVMPVFAYDQHNTHPALTDEIVDFYNLNFSEKKITEEEKQWLIKGSMDEDTLERPLYHFYDPVYNRGIAGISSKDWATKDGVQAAYYNGQLTGFAAISSGDSANDFSYQRALRDYAKGDRKRAFVAFGHTLHLLEDAGVPDHTRNDAHPSFIHGQESPYEHEMAKWSPQNFQIARLLFLKREKPVSLSSVESYFDRIARYSNGYFFSKDTISNNNYASPSTKKLARLFVKGKSRLFIINENNKQTFPLALVREVGGENLNDSLVLISPKIGSYILDGYWERLSKEVVINGAGALRLFLEEAEAAKQEYLAKTEQKKPGLWAQVLGVLGVGGEDDDKLATSEDLGTSDVNDNRLMTSDGQRTSDVTTPDVGNPQVVKDGDTGDSDGDKKVSPSLSPVLSPKPLVPPLVSPAPEPELTISGGQRAPDIKTTGRVVINEIAWAGTEASAADEWIELFNTENYDIDISSWTLKAEDGTPDIVIKEGKVIKAQSYFLLERTNDITVNSIPADQIYTGALGNEGEFLKLSDSLGIVVDTAGNSVGEWPFGNSSGKISMERTASGWKDFTENPSAKDANGNFIRGTPKALNSLVTFVVTGGGGGSSSPSSSPTPTPTPIPSPEPETGKININTASKDELITLPGIGEVKSQAIIDYRTANGPFAKIEDIQNVSGIGPVTFNNIKDLVTVGDVVIKPSAITNLAAAHNSPTVTATWSAPDPGTYSPASLSYDMRYYTVNFPDDGTWDMATQVASSSLPSVGIQGASQSASFDVVYGYGQMLYFALKTKVINIPTCDVGNVDKCSGVSNVAVVSFPSAIDDGAWAMFGKDQYHTSLANVTGPGTTATISWEFDAGTGNAISQPVADADGNVYFGAADGSSGKLIKLNKNSVKQWEYSTNVSIGTPAVIADGTVYFGRVGAGGVLAFTALNSDGSKKWDYDNTSTVRSVAISSKGEPHFTYTSGTDKLLVLNTDGSAKTTVNNSGLSGFAPVVLDDGTIITAGKVSGNQQFTAYSATGSQSWQLSYTGTNGSTPADPSYDKSIGITYSAAGPKLFSIPSGGSVLNSTNIAPWNYTATTVAVSADTLYIGFNSPGFGLTTNEGSIFVNDASIGATDWTNPDRAKTENNSYASVLLEGAGSASKYLKATGFNFNIPANSSINGVKLEIRKSSAGEQIKDFSVRIVKNGNISGNNKADLNSWPSGAGTYVVYGGESDLWGLSLTPSDINADDFGMAIATILPVNGQYVGGIDNIKMTVYYTEPSLLYALNKSGFSAKWSFAADGLLNKQLAIDSAGNVYFSTQNGKLYSVDSAGNQRWAIETGSNSTISPVLTEERGLVWGYGSRVVKISD